jgi:hypothetical protein
MDVDRLPAKKKVDVSFAHNGSKILIPKGALHNSIEKWRKAHRICLKSNQGQSRINEQLLHVAR